MKARGTKPNMKVVYDSGVNRKRKDDRRKERKLLRAIERRGRVIVYCIHSGREEEELLTVLKGRS